jgi:hypothetical protein
MELEPHFNNRPYDRTSRCYEPFKSFLSSSGFTVYRVEFDCMSSRHPFVDIAAKIGLFYWAFEYKSQNDSISRGVDQLRCCSRWFDYVVLVSERFFSHRRSDSYWSLKHLGAGIWFYDPAQDKCVQTCNPRIQSPSAGNRSLVARRFGTLSRTRRRANANDDSSHQLDLCLFVS